MTWPKMKACAFFARTMCSLALLLLTFSVTDVHAQVGQESAPSGAKATVGLALLGAEAVVSVEALIGVKPWWGYAIGGGLGAVAGGVGGYFIDRTDNTELSMGLLVGGIVLAVPTAVAVLSATSYKPPRNPEVDSATFEQRQSLALAQAIAAKHQMAHERAPAALVSMRSLRSAELQMPAFSIQPVYSQAMRQTFDLPQAASFRLPVVNLRF